MTIQESHEEAAEELPKKVKFFFSAAIEAWDAEFYVKIDDNINLDLGNFGFQFLSVKLFFPISDQLISASLSPDSLLLSISWVNWDA